MKFNKHVLESNAIEGIFDLDGPLLENHLLAARCVELAAAEGDLIHPKVLHAILFHNVQLPLQHIPGDYRNCDVRVGDYLAIPHIQVLGEMLAWYREIWHMVPWRNHFYFESIHPFIDGNGRVGRLVLWNQQMLRDEEPTLILAAEKQEYYDKIEKWRKDNDWE